MKQIAFIDHLFLITIELLLLFYEGFHPTTVLYLLVSILILTPTILWKEAHGAEISLSALILLSLQWPLFLFFLPSLMRFVWRKKPLLIGLTLLQGLILLFQPLFPIVLRFLLLLLSIFAAILAIRQNQNDQLYQDWLKLKDDSWEKQERLKQQNTELVQSRETIIDLEISEERNRIARDIHDNVGHLLSSAIIQLGAIEAMNQSEILQKPLKQLEETIHTGMDNIRGSVHDLHEDSLSLEKSLDLLLVDFHFCPVSLEGPVPAKINQQQEKVLLLIVKEALTNVMKHSNATQVTLTFHELPAFHRLQIYDNGTKKSQQTAGIGLVSMRQRISKLGGQIHINDKQNGFLITVILPKDANSTI